MHTETKAALGDPEFACEVEQAAVAEQGSHPTAERMLVKAVALLLKRIKHLEETAQSTEDRIVVLEATVLSADNRITTLEAEMLSMDSATDDLDTRVTALEQQEVEE